MMSSIPGVEVDAGSSHQEMQTPRSGPGRHRWQYTSSFEWDCQVQTCWIVQATMRQALISQARFHSGQSVKGGVPLSEAPHDLHWQPRHGASLMSHLQGCHQPVMHVLTATAQLKALPCLLWWGQAGLVTARRKHAVQLFG